MHAALQPLVAVDTEILRSLAQAPRLVVDASQWRGLSELARQNRLPLWPELRRRADELAGQERINLNDSAQRAAGTGLLVAARRMQERVLTFACVARIADDESFARLAVREMQAAAAAADWNPSHFLDTAELTLALALGIDWLDDRLSAEERAGLELAIIEKGLRPSFSDSPEYAAWRSKTNNWGQVCHAGLVAGALCVAEREPDLAERVVERALKALPCSAAAYAPVGVYPEGPMYWGYGTTFHVILISLLKSALGRDFGLHAFPGFLESADFVQQMTGPNGTFFNYGDGREERPFQPVLYWFGRRLGRTDLIAAEDAALARLSEGAARAKSAGLESERFLSLGLLWRSQVRPAQEAPRPAHLPLHWRADGRVPVCAHRTSWEDSQAAFLAAKGGLCGTSHAHMDVGAFVFEKYGVRWAVDPDFQPYDSLTRPEIALWNFGQTSSRWDVFRIGPEAHNILRFDGARQMVSGRAVFGSEAGPLDETETRFKLDAVYAGQVLRASRRLRLDTEGVMTIHDEWTTGDRAREVSWQWLTRAHVTPVPGGVELEQAGRTLRLLVAASAPWRIEVRDCAPPRCEYDWPNPGLKRIDVLLSTPAYRSGWLNVRAA